MALYAPLSSAFLAAHHALHAKSFSHGSLRPVECAGRTICFVRNLGVGNQAPSPQQRNQIRGGRAEGRRSAACRVLQLDRSIGQRSICIRSVRTGCVLVAPRCGVRPGMNPGGGQADQGRLTLTTRLYRGETQSQSVARAGASVEAGLRLNVRRRTPPPQLKTQSNHSPVPRLPRLQLHRESEMTANEMARLRR